MIRNAEALIQKYSHKFGEYEIQKGCLYVVSTPIGNLEDISFRALHVLKCADFIACEDTRRTGILLSEFQIRNKLVSYYSHVESEKLGFIIEELSGGKSVALVSDSGTPCISDPGGILVRKCIEKEIKIISIPGSSALIHSLVVSGFELKKFYYHGFLPKKKGRQSIFEELVKINMLIVIYESPFRILKTLEDILKYFGNVEVSVSRELTKKFEQTLRGNVKTLLRQGIKTKGEFVITINNTR